jgi:hypothetical protein
MPSGLQPSGRAGRKARATRAYLAGIGTSGSLLAGAALMFILGSALVAFRGWPHVAAQPSPGEVVISPRSASAAISPAARRLAFITAAAGPGATAAPATGAAGGAGGRRAVPGTGRPRPAPASGSRTGGGTAPSGGGSSSSSPGCASGGCGSGSGAGSGLVPPSTPATPVLQKGTSTLGEVVGDAGSTVGSAVQQTTGAVGGAVGTVSPSVGGAVSSTGTGAAKALGGVTQTFDGVLSHLSH